MRRNIRQKIMGLIGYSAKIREFTRMSARKSAAGLFADFHGLSRVVLVRVGPQSDFSRLDFRGHSETFAKIILAKTWSLFKIRLTLGSLSEP